jgi:hypothetical protein
MPCIRALLNRVDRKGVNERAGKGVEWRVVAVADVGRHGRRERGKQEYGVALYFWVELRGVGGWTEMK